MMCLDPIDWIFQSSWLSDGVLKSTEVFWWHSLLLSMIVSSRRDLILLTENKEYNNCLEYFFAVLCAIFLRSCPMYFREIFSSQCYPTNRRTVKGRRKVLVCLGQTKFPPKRKCQEEKIASHVWKQDWCMLKNVSEKRSNL